MATDVAQPDDPEVAEPTRRRVFLAEGGRGRLESVEGALKQLGTSLEPVADALGDGWMVFYDNAAGALTQRGWWLCEVGGNWSLRMPTLPSDANPFGFEEKTANDEILEVCGLTQFAELVRKKPATRIDKLLEQADVVPIARLRRSRQTCGLDFNSGALAAADGTPDAPAQVVVEISQLHFDVKPAEDQAVADLLFDKGSEARSSLEAMLVDFRWPGAAEEDVLGVQQAVAALGDQMLGEKVVGVSHHAAFPEAVAYIRLLRPEHMRRLDLAHCPLLAE